MRRYLIAVFSAIYISYPHRFCESVHHLPELVLLAIYRANPVATVLPLFVSARQNTILRRRASKKNQHIFVVFIQNPTLLCYRKQVNLKRTRRCDKAKYRSTSIRSRSRMMPNDIYFLINIDGKSKIASRDLQEVIIWSSDSHSTTPVRTGHKKANNDRIDNSASAIRVTITRCNLEPRQ